MLIVIGVGVACFFLLRFLKACDGDKSIIVIFSALAAIGIGGTMLAPKIGEYFPQVPTTYDNGQPVELALMRDANYPDGAFYLVQTDAKHYAYKEASDGKLRELNTDSSLVIVSVVGWNEHAIGVERYDPRFVHSMDYLFALPSNKVQYMFRLPPGTFHKNFVPS